MKYKFPYWEKIIKLNLFPLPFQQLEKGLGSVLITAYINIFMETKYHTPNGCVTWQERHNMNQSLESVSNQIQIGNKAQF